MHTQSFSILFFFSSRRRHTRFALVTGVQTCALPISSQLHLLELDGAPAAPALGGEVLVVPWEASLMIRACFSDADMMDRLDACHDEYVFGATLAVASMARVAFPTLSYRVLATAFPLTSRLSSLTFPSPLTLSPLFRSPFPLFSFYPFLPF